MPENGRKYILNKKTGCLHIRGLCPHAQDSDNTVAYDTEQSAYEYGGRAIRMCKRCMSKRDKNGGKNNE